jgi:hypothetical protein
MQNSNQKENKDNHLSLKIELNLFQRDNPKSDFLN